MVLRLDQRPGTGEQDSRAGYRRCCSLTMPELRKREGTVDSRFWVGSGPRFFFLPTRVGSGGSHFFYSRVYSHSAVQQPRGGRRKEGEARVRQHLACQGGRCSLGTNLLWLL